MDSHNVPNQLQSPHRRPESVSQNQNEPSDGDGAREQRREEMRELLLTRIREKTQHHLRS
jgi:hypothetical protein